MAGSSGMMWFLLAMTLFGELIILTGAHPETRCLKVSDKMRRVPFVNFAMDAYLGT